jgi:hypothetical protein
MTDEAMTAVLQRLRWSYFGDRDPRYLDPDNTTATDSTAAEARFIEWALLEYRSVPGASTLMHAWLTNHGMDFSPTGPFAPWVRSVSGGFTVDILDVRHSTGVLRSIDSDRTFATTGLARLRPEIGDVIVGRLVPDAPGDAAGTVPGDVRTWHVSPATVVAPARARELARRARAQIPHIVGAASQHDDAPASLPLNSESWLGATPLWPSDYIGLPELLSETDTFFADVGIYLAASYLLDELSGLDHPLAVWARLVDDLEIDSVVEGLVLASFVTALWATASIAVLERVDTMSPSRLHKWFADIALGLVAHTARRMADPDATDDPPLPPPREGAWSPPPDLRDQLKALPRTDAYWTGERRIVALARQGENGLPEYWHAIIWAEDTTAEAVAIQLCPAHAPHDELWRVFAAAAISPAAGQPRLPSGAVCSRIQNAATAHDALSGLGVHVDVDYEPATMDDLFIDVESDLLNDPAYQPNPAFMTQYLALPHNESADVRELWEAAAAMYRLEPWTVVKAAMLMLVHIDDDPDPRVAVWSGDAGNRRSGLMLYDNAWALVNAAASASAGGDEAPHFDATSVTFPQGKHGFEPLVREAEAHGWPLARGRYPVFAVRTGTTAPPRLVCGDEVRGLTAILLAFTRLVERHRAEFAAGDHGMSERVDACGHRIRIEAQAPLAGEESE